MHISTRCWNLKLRSFDSMQYLDILLIWFVFNKLIDGRRRVGDAMLESKVGEAKEPKFERYPTWSFLWCYSHECQVLGGVTGCFWAPIIAITSLYELWWCSAMARPGVPWLESAGLISLLSGLSDSIFCCLVLEGFPWMLGAELLIPEVAHYPNFWILFG